jgi:hypothetical protein
MKSDDSISNRSGNRPFHDILQTNLQRRSLLKGSVAVATASVLGVWGPTQARTRTVRTVPGSGAWVRSCIPAPAG